MYDRTSELEQYHIKKIERYVILMYDRTSELEQYHIIRTIPYKENRALCYLNVR